LPTYCVVKVLNASALSGNYKIEVSAIVEELAAPQK
jgi:hypothetical protein